MGGGGGGTIHIRGEAKSFVCVWGGGGLIFPVLPPS